MSASPQQPNDNLTPEEANHIIHSHRKVRYGTACWPCRQRKVKCDNKQPCENCVKRDHASLCSYNPKKQIPKSSGKVVTGVKRALSPGCESPSRHGDERWPATNDEEEPDGSRYLGRNSIAAFISEEARAGQAPIDSEQKEIRQDIMPLLGLKVASAPYPFMSKAHMDQIRHDISADLPSDKEILKGFQIFQHIVQPFWAFMINIDDFETKLCSYLEDRTASNQRSATGKGVSSAWLGMLFAVLAISFNYSDMSYHKRTTMAHSYVQNSFHCLRLSNFLIRPSLESLQALLIIGFVLVNDQKAEASWALLGMTCRLAQALGLHRERSDGGRSGLQIDDLSRRKLWWTIVWHDTLLSLSFDRAPVTVVTRCQLPISPTALTEGFTYTEAMYRLCQKILQGLNNDSTCQRSFEQIMEDTLEVEDIRQQLQPRLRSIESSVKFLDRLQHYGIRLHTAFVVSVFCRPALRRSQESGLTQAEKGILGEKCKQNLIETVRMYLKLHSLSVIPTRSWAFTYHSLSSAVLLGILGETKTDPEVRQLQGELISALSDTAAREGTSTSGKDIELSGPLSRALAALKNIYDHGWVVDTKASSVALPEAQIPPPPDPGDFDQQNAALTMASMQNGMLPPLDYAPQMMPLGTSDPQTLEQTLNMSPMDLFDSIFWDAYPNNEMPGLDQLGGFDFSQQMYPSF